MGTAARRVAFAFVAAASAAWLAALVAAPMTLARPDAPLSARGTALAVHVAGGFVCHQLPHRSFHISGVPMPVCARCTGLYVGSLRRAAARRDLDAHRTPGPPVARRMAGNRGAPDAGIGRGRMGNGPHVGDLARGRSHTAWRRSGGHRRGSAAAAAGRGESVCYTTLIRAGCPR